MLHRPSYVWGGLDPPESATGARLAACNPIPRLPPCTSSARYVEHLPPPRFPLVFCCVSITTLHVKINQGLRSYELTER